MSDREQNLVMGLVVILAGVVVYYGLIPVATRYQNLRKSVEAEARGLRRDTNLLRRIADIQARARKTRDRLRRMVPGNLPEDGFSVLLSRLEEQALRAGLTEANIDRFNQVSDRTHGPIRELRVRAHFVDVTRLQLIRLLWRYRTRLGRATRMRYRRVNLQLNTPPRKRIPTVELGLVFFGLDRDSIPDPERDPH